MSMKNVLYKITIIITIALLLINITPIKSKAETVDEMISAGKDFISQGKSSKDVTLFTGNIKETSDVIYNVFLGVGIVIVLAVGMVIGIRFMMASAEDKADIKQTLIPYIIGSFIIFASFGIWKLFIILGRNVDTGTGTSVQTQEPDHWQQGGSTVHRSSSGDIHGGGGF